MSAENDETEALEALVDSMAAAFLSSGQPLAIYAPALSQDWMRYYARRRIERVLGTMTDRIVAQAKAQKNTITREEARRGAIWLLLRERGLAT